MNNEIWKTHTVDSEKGELHVQIDTLHIWLKRKNDEFWVASSNETEGEDLNKPVDELPADKIKWTRYAKESSTSEVDIKPVFPNLPVIISSEYPLKIAAGSKIHIYTRVPVWAQIKLKKEEYILTEIPSRKLNRTWFGNPVEGELCYWQSTRARRNLTDLNNSVSLINCPITIINKTHEELNFEKFCFRVDRLSIFDANDELWADQTVIEYHGEEQNSDISMTGKLPASMGTGTLLSKPRNPIPNSFATRTFKKLFDDTFISAK